MTSHSTAAIVWALSQAMRKVNQTAQTDLPATSLGASGSGR
jgi:hypothetical protein